jgi:hypothetical protein
MRMRESRLGGIFDRARRCILGPPMIGAPLLEVAHGTWAGAFACRDAQGRFLGERSANERAWGRPPHTEWKTWRAAGSRQGRSYNATAMRQIAENWPMLLADVGVIRRLHGCRNLADLFSIARIVTSIPAFLFRRSREPLRDGRLHPCFAGAFKVMAGVHALVEHSIRVDRGPDFADLPAADELVGFLERDGLFVSASGHACAGPESMVCEILSLTMHGRSEQDGDRERLAERIGDLDALLRYGRACARIDACLLLLEVLLQGRPAARAHALGELLGVGERGHRWAIAPLPDGNSDWLRNRVVASFAPVLARLQLELAAAHRALGRQRAPKRDRICAAVATRLGFDPIGRLIECGAMLDEHTAPLAAGEAGLDPVAGLIGAPAPSVRDG